MNKIEEIAGKILGVKLTEYQTTYDPSLLVPVPRKLNREQYGIEANNLPFQGWDVWHAYEVSFLTENGMPVLGVGKLMYPADSELFIESKSLKLYFYSMNMMMYGKNSTEGCKIVEEVVRRDISSTLNISIEEIFFSIHLSNSKNNKCFEDFEVLGGEEFGDIVFNKYQEAPEVLEISFLRWSMLEQYAIPFLRSNCRVTHQPDYGTMYIAIKGDKKIVLSSLLSYIVSFRNEFHFHEEVVEMVYKRLWDKFTPSALFVGALYTRRGGIDICPMRYSDITLCPKEILDVKTLTQKTLNQ